MVVVVVVVIVAVIVVEVAVVEIKFKNIVCHLVSLVTYLYQYCQKLMHLTWIYSQHIIGLLSMDIYDCAGQNIYLVTILYNCSNCIRRFTVSGLIINWSGRYLWKNAVMGDLQDNYSIRVLLLP